jgi:hypothetical protein
MKRPPKRDYSEEETGRRFEAALRGAREVGHKPMKDISPKRPTTQKRRNNLQGKRES